MLFQFVTGRFQSASKTVQNWKNASKSARGPHVISHRREARVLLLLLKPITALPFLIANKVAIFLEAWMIKPLPPLRTARETMSFIKDIFQDDQARSSKSP